MAKVPDELPWKPTGRTIGSGGQAQVLEVVRREEPDGARYAMKVLAQGKPKKTLERFTREIDALSQIESPDVVRIVDHSVSQALFQYYVMELHEGSQSLHSLIGAESNPYAGNAIQVLRLFASLTRAMREYSRLGIVHRDLSPANVLVMPDASIRLIDFGICQIEDGTPITLTDENMGTRNYAAPECEAGSSEKVGIQADLYSAGKILWAAVTNRPVFARELPAFKQSAIRMVLPQAYETWHLQRLIAKTIRHNPRKRFESPEDALAEVVRVQRLVQFGYVPLEVIDVMCPICGYGRVDHMELGHAVFGNPNPKGIESLQCTQCGYSVVVNTALKQRRVHELYPADER